MKKLNLEDIVQVCLGSVILAIPVALSEEAWSISRELPLINIYFILFISLLLNGCFIYYGVYEGVIENKKLRFVSRIFINYILSLCTVSGLLFLLNIIPNMSDYIPSLSLVILVSFPASLSGAVLDSFDKE